MVCPPKWLMTLSDKFKLQGVLIMADFTQNEVSEILEDVYAAKIDPSTLLPKGSLMGTGGYVAIKAAQKGHVGTLKYLHQHGVDLGAEVIGNGIAGWYPA